MNQTAQKEELRALLLAARKGLSAELRAASSARIAEHVLAIPAFAQAAVVATYACLGAEVDPSPIATEAAQRGKVVVYPRTTPGSRALTFARATPGGLRRGPLGAPEPDAEQPEFPTPQIEVILVPGIGFDPLGHRLGRGRGHYDATLAALKTRCLRIGLAFELQLVERVPVEPHDVPVHAIATEARLLWIDSGAASR